jgi:hypothetical protein
MDIEKIPVLDGVFADLKLENLVYAPLLSLD